MKKQQIWEKLYKNLLDNIYFYNNYDSTYFNNKRSGF